LSTSQFGIYVECASHGGEAFYNLPYIYVLDRSLDGERLLAAIETAFKAHPTLFTRIELNDNGDPIQTLDMDNEPWSLAIEDIEDIEQEKPKLVTPYDINGGRLFHVKLMRNKEHYYLFLDYHHIIVDGTSMQIMLQDIDKAYRGEPIAPEELTLMQVAEAEAQLRQTEALNEGRQWYAANFDCGDTFTQFMPDLEEPEHREDHLLRTLSLDLDRVDDYCKQHGVFKSTLFTTAYAFLLAKFNNEQESLFTTVYNGRSDKRFSHSVGMTVKTLPVYAKFTADTTVLELLQQGQEQMGGCRKHEAYTYSDVMTDLNLQSNSMFAWHGQLFDNETMGGMPMQTIRIGNSTLDASFYMKVFIQDGKCQVKAEYNANEYSQAFISQILESYEAVLEGFISQQFLREVDITTASQIETLDSFNENDVDYDASQTIVSLFKQQVQATPQNVAVVYKDKSFTYKQVDEISDRIAAHLATLGLQTEDVVSVLIPRCEWMAIASLGVLKAGCAYQPLDPSYPKERLNFMMQDASAKLLIADEELRPIVDEYQGEVLLTKDIMALPAQSAPDVEIQPDNLFIMLYTS
ncbi:MAG: AMP-binding protein, partial [Muribaculaceae bacterium]|nr:AMP-binding protein [Muribaculaceae bacterium]